MCAVTDQLDSLSSFLQTDQHSLSDPSQPAHESPLFPSTSSASHEYQAGDVDSINEFLLGLGQNLGSVPASATSEHHPSDAFFSATTGDAFEASRSLYPTLPGMPPRHDSPPVYSSEQQQQQQSPTSAAVSPGYDYAQRQAYPNLSINPNVKLSKTPAPATISSRERQFPLYHKAELLTRAPPSSSSTSSQDVRSRRPSLADRKALMDVDETHHAESSLRSTSLDVVDEDGTPRRRQRRPTDGFDALLRAASAAESGTTEALLDECELDEDDRDVARLAPIAQATAAMPHRPVLPSIRALMDASTSSSPSAAPSQPTSRSSSVASTSSSMYPSLVPFAHSDRSSPSSFSSSSSTASLTSRHHPYRRPASSIDGLARGMDDMMRDDDDDSASSVALVDEPDAMTDSGSAIDDEDEHESLYPRLVKRTRVDSPDLMHVDDASSDAGSDTLSTRSSQTTRRASAHHVAQADADDGEATKKRFEVLKALIVYVNERFRRSEYERLLREHQQQQQQQQGLVKAGSQDPETHPHPQDDRESVDRARSRESSAAAASRSPTPSPAPSTAAVAAAPSAPVATA